MNKSIKLIIALGVIMMAATSCKTKQKIAEIPAGANVEATAPKTVVTQPSVTQTQTPAPSEANEPEVTRNENFSLANGETNSDAMNYKYHVVVGSFKSQSNAQGLQKTLNSEGNKAVIVVNEQGMFRVLIASFNDYKQAHVRIKDLASRFPDAWVLVKK
ncbi:MAG: SPOR domain-containing protein [Paludibacter sp.]|jgi:cell division protein FtsN